MQKYNSFHHSLLTAFQNEIERGIMTESSPQPHVTKAPDQIKSFLSVQKIFFFFPTFIENYLSGQYGKIRTGNK